MNWNPGSQTEKLEKQDNTVYTWRKWYQAVSYFCAVWGFPAECCAQGEGILLWRPVSHHILPNPFPTDHLAISFNFLEAESQFSSSCSPPEVSQRDTALSAAVTLLWPRAEAFAMCKGRKLPFLASPWCLCWWCFTPTTKSAQLFVFSHLPHPVLRRIHNWMCVCVISGGNSFALFIQ